MILIGYQGIGNSTLALKENNFIDLESSNFFYKDKRIDNWYIYSCNIAAHLSKQGFNVFVSSHEVVRSRLKKYSKEKLYIICPSVELKKEWIDKLKERFKSSKLGKDYKAWMNAEDRYSENIKELIESGINCVLINSMDYNLKEIIEFIIKTSEQEEQIEDL